MKPRDIPRSCRLVANGKGNADESHHGTSGDGVTGSAINVPSTRYRDWDDSAPFLVIGLWKSVYAIGGAEVSGRRISIDLSRVRT
jgi:hypothetical protein